MTDLVKRFIEDNIRLIEENKWEEIYQKASADLKFYTGKFTEVMLSADIHPEWYLKELPRMFLFLNGNLSNFYIPDSVISIGERAFYNCRSLTSIEIPNSVTNIGDYAFEECSSLTSLIIADSVISIGDSAFKYCNSLTNVTIPTSVITIDSYAFYGCKDLNITYIGTKEQWKNIAKGKFSGVTYTCTCIDGVIKKSR